jgi:hypothetical protein
MESKATHYSSDFTFYSSSLLEMLSIAQSE